MATNLTPTTTPLPEGICETITSEQSRLDAFAAHMVVTIPNSLTGVVVSTTPPADTSVVWMKVDQNAKPVRLYKHWGRWLSQHPLPPGFIMLWTDALPNLNTFDGGEAGDVFESAGPMWELVANSSARFPLGVGTLPSTASVAANATAGAETVILDKEQLPVHSHTITSEAGCDINQTSNRTLAGTDGDAGEFQGSMSTGETGSGNPVNIMPPWFGVYFLRRTNRVFYAES